MTIETKYNIGDIHANIDCDGKIRINYEVWGDTIKEESILFPTKEELLKSL